MRRILCCGMIAACLIGCAGNPQAAPPDPPPATGQAIKVYFKVEGSDHDVKRFQRFVDIALDDYGMLRESSAANANAIVKVQLKEPEEKERDVYAPVSFVTFTSSPHEGFTVRSCNSVYGQKTTEPMTYVDVIHLPSTWTKEFPHLSIYMDESRFNISEGLVKNLKERLAEAHYRVAKSKAEADAEVTNIKVQILTIPMRAMIRSRHYEIVDRESDQVYSTMNGTDDFWLGPNTSINLKNFPCGQTIATFGQTTSTDPFWSDASSIAKTIQEHSNKKAAHSN